MTTSRTVRFTAFLPLLMLAACARPYHETPAALSGPRIVPSYPAVSGDHDLVMTGSVRIDLPKYRVRGSCGITRFSDGLVMIEFVHSSLFGSYREEATIYVEDGRMTIHDLRRAEVWDDGEAAAMLSENLGIEVFPDDIPEILLLAALQPDAGAGDYGTNDGRCRMKGRWRGRDLSVELDDSGRRIMMQVCADGRTACYQIKYGYKDDSLLPEKIVISNLAGPERLSLVITGVVEESLTKE
ncbi:MAG TPA: hypothetical protein VLA34_07285 [Candidatus Krumholzibacterium sp.]|nr:hypothetical protein [Candidatus Krumholzibacterium sp.]